MALSKETKEYLELILLHEFELIDKELDYIYQNEKKIKEIVTELGLNDFTKE